jgi:enoyl-CoA hydratase/carnithine racemase
VSKFKHIALIHLPSIVYLLPLVLANYFLSCDFFPQSPGSSVFPTHWMILTGRPVTAEEAERMGLANGVVESGNSQTESEAIAQRIANFTQRCLLSDRRSVYEQCGFSLQEAMRNEFRHRVLTIQSGKTLEGTSRFLTGAGRHGTFD